MGNTLGDFLPCSCVLVALLRWRPGRPSLSFSCPCCPALLEHSRTLLLVSSGNAKEMRDPLYLQYQCGQRSWYPRISWPRPKHTQELSKALSCHLTKQCVDSSKKKIPCFFQLSHPNACLDSGLDFFFSPLGSRWHSASFLSLFWFQWITFQMRGFILERSWLCWRSNLRGIPEHEAPCLCCFSFQPCPLPWGISDHSFPRALALATPWDVFYLLREYTELESSIIQALHGFKAVLSLSARSQNSELIHAFPIHNWN